MSESAEERAAYEKTVEKFLQKAPERKKGVPHGRRAGAGAAVRAR